MANEKNDKFEGQDEGEYHFSDDQMNYEMEDVPAPEAPKSATRANISEKKADVRRYLIGGMTFVFLLYVVYKMMIPVQAPPSTEITQATAPPHSANTVKAAAVALPPPTAQVIPITQPNPMAMPVVPQAAPQPVPVQQQPSSAMPVVVVGSPLPSAPVDAKTIIDKLTSLEQQNSKLTYAVDTEYAQKLSSYEAQNTALQTKIQDLSGRITNLEAGLAQLTQLLQGQKPVQPMASLTQEGVSPLPPQRQAEPKVAYTVQAIIPGRAWLKSDAGDTITVAEGDILKNFGKVIKLDPYDGVVEVDTGIKVVTLTYGGGTTT